MAGSISGIDWVSRMPVSGTYTAVTADDNAGYATIATGMTGATGFIVQVLRSGAPSATDGKFSISAGALKVEDGSTYKVTAGDVINWIVF